MSDPKRLRDSDGEPLGLLMIDLSKAEPREDVRAQLWSKIAATLPAGPGSGSPSGSAPTSPIAGTTSGGIGAVKLGSLLAVMMATGAALWWMQKPVDPSLPIEPAPVIASPTLVLPSPSRLLASAEADDEAVALPVIRTDPNSVITKGAPSVIVAPDPVAVSAAMSVIAPPQTIQATEPDRLREEAEGVRNARHLLRAGNPSAALDVLDRLAARMPNGPLEEEREVLTIDGLFAAKRTDAATKRADRFLLERPQSIHAARVRSLLAAANGGGE